MEKRPNNVGAIVSGLYFTYREDKRPGSDLYLDLIEYIAQRVEDASPDQLASLGAFVRRVLDAADMEIVTENDALARLSQAAIYAPVGGEKFSSILAAPI